MPIPHYPDPPEHWRAPMGPYRQAPAEYGGEWWYVYPFNPEPWLSTPVDAPTLPDGFEEIFGAGPVSEDFRDFPNPSQAFRAARDLWAQDLKHFKQAGPPPWALGADLDASAAVFVAWDMGAPKHYEGRYGWMTRFPDSQFRDFEAAAWTAIQVTHLTVAQYQIRLAHADIIPNEKHPFVPSHIWGE